MAKPLLKTLPLAFPLPAAETGHRKVRHFSVNSKWLSEGDSRLDATTYADEVYSVLHALEQSPYPKVPISKVVARVYHPTENQPRSNFKRIWVSAEEGVPFLSGRQLFFFRPEREKHVSRRMPKLNELKVPKGTILLSRSGTTGSPVLVGEWLSQFAVTDDALRIFRGSAPVGFVYAYLASSLARTLVTKGAYGSTVSHLEAKHIATVPIPLLPEVEQREIHRKIIAAYKLRDQANKLLDVADDELHTLLGVSPFSERDIEYLGPVGAPRAFAISSSDLGLRFDATNHVPVVRSAIRKLKTGKFELVDLGTRCANVTIPPRFKRQYVSLDHGVPYLLPSHIVTMRPYGMKALSFNQAEHCPEYLLREGELLLTTDGTVGRVHPVTKEMVGWFGSNNMARLSDSQTNMGFLYAFLSTPFGKHQVRREIYGGVVDHIEEHHITSVLIPDVPPEEQKRVGDLVWTAFEKKNAANALENQAIFKVEATIA